MFSCNNNYKEAEELYTQGVNEKSKTLLTSANRKLDMIKENHSDYNKAHLLKTKIDSIKKRWDFNTKLRLKRKNDSIAEIRAIQVKILEDKELKKYPNLVGRWKLESSSYSSLNSIVRIYKENGVYYRSMKFKKDGSQSVMKLSKKSKIRFDVVGKSDYLLIAPSGDLMFWDKQGYFLTCKQINLEDID